MTHLKSGSSFSWYKWDFHTLYVMLKIDAIASVAVRPFFSFFFFRKMVSCHVTTGKMRKLKKYWNTFRSPKICKICKSKRNTHDKKKKLCTPRKGSMNIVIAEAMDYSDTRNMWLHLGKNEKKRRRKKETVRLNNRKIEKKREKSRCQNVQLKIKPREIETKFLLSFFFSTFIRNIYRHSLINGKTYYFLIASYRFVFCMRIYGWIYFRVSFIFIA